MDAYPERMRRGDCESDKEEAVMSIDRKEFLKGAALSAGSLAALGVFGCAPGASSGTAGSCLLYTSDAADEL